MKTGDTQFMYKNVVLPILMYDEAMLSYMTSLTKDPKLFLKSVNGILYLC